MVKNINFSSVSKEVLKQKRNVKKIVWWVGENTFLSLLIFISLSLFLGSAVFYKYSFLVEMREYKIIEKPLQFEEKNYGEVLRTWEIKGENFKEANKKEYRNPFQKEDLEEEIQEEEGEFITKEDEPQSLIYTVVRGDNLWDLATKYLGTGFRWREITDTDGNSFPDWRAEFLRIGEELLIPLDG